MDRDKLIELERYDARAQAQLSNVADFGGCSRLGSDAIRRSLRSPYLLYEQLVREIIKANHQVLEIAAGTGMHTQALLQTGAHVTAVDISPKSLRLLEKRIQAGTGHLMIKVADMEALPFADNSFDIVTCAGGMSYGDNQLVLNEIYRVLKTGGCFIVIDSLNHNPIYQLNRFLHYIRRNRSKNTLTRMPTLNLLNDYRTAFGFSELNFFGAIAWLVAPMSKIIGENRAAEWSDRVDKILRIKRSAFKFVMIARKHRENAA
jgi:ubiquinone/menaquinone biosynthesis C-methylase UbiE